MISATNFPKRGSPGQGLPESVPRTARDIFYDTEPGVKGRYILLRSGEFLRGLYAWGSPENNTACQAYCRQAA